MKKTKKEKDIAYMNIEKNFIRGTLRRIFKPSTINPKKYKNISYIRKAWVPEITLEELYEELFLHIQNMKDKFPESDGKLCRYCDQPWTYIRKGDNITRKTTWTNFSLDRFNSEQTYKKGNVIFCCSKCNSLKNGSTKAMWIRFLEIDKELNNEKN